MKKIVTSFIILIIAILMYQTVYATENSTGASVVFNFSGDSKVTQGTKNSNIYNIIRRLCRNSRKCNDGI